MRTTIDVKEAILITAKELFIKKGYNGTSIRDIATASGSNVAMVNYYYGSKYELFEIVFEESFDILMTRIFTVLDNDMPFFDMLSCWISSYYDILVEHPQIPIFILNEVNTNPEKLSERLRSRNPYRLLLKVSARINEESKKGTIKETDPIDFLLNVMSLCIFPFMFRTIATRVAEISQEEYQIILDNHKNYVIKFVIDAIRPVQTTEN